MKLHNLKIGKSKKKMELVMTDEMPAIKFYLQSRASTGSLQGRCTGGWYEVVDAPPNAIKWRKKSTTIGGNKPTRVPRIGKDGKNRVAGYISKHGFQPHT